MEIDHSYTLHLRHMGTGEPSIAAGPAWTSAAKEKTVRMRILAARRDLLVEGLARLIVGDGRIRRFCAGLSHASGTKAGCSSA